MGGGGQWMRLFKNRVGRERRLLELGVFKPAPHSTQLGTRK